MPVSLAPQYFARTSHWHFWCYFHISC